MFRRSRLSIRPNVGTTGRTVSAPQEALSSNKDLGNANTQVETPVSVTDTKSTDAPIEPSPGDSNDQHGEAAGSSAIQRRKRFSVKPKVVPGRPSALPRTSKSPIKPVLPPAKSPAPVIDKTATSIEANANAPLQEILSPKECKLSNTDIVSPSEGSSKDINQPANTAKIQPCSQEKEISTQAPAPPSIPDRETIEISEKAKTLVFKTQITTSSEQFSLSQLLNDKSDLVRLEKARKLRQLLKEEMLKVKSKKSKARAKEQTLTLDPSKMTMRDLIHYLPTSNPMSSALEETQQENETVIPQSPEREASPERAQEPEEQPKTLSFAQEETPAAASAAEEQEDEEEEAAEDEDALMVPQVKVAEDGSLIIDEESLTVEVQRMKGPNTIQDRDPIFERGSTTTYSSFRKGTHTKPWSTEETDMFFLAISMVGTDFTMICQLFPHRARTEIKNKFKKEERHNAWRIDKAFRERRKLDLEYFKKLLEKILEFQQSKKKLKSISVKDKTPRKRKRKTKGKQDIVNLSDVEEETEAEMSNEEQEGEKENLCNDITTTSKPKRKRKDKDDLPPDPQVDKKKREKKNVPDSEEAALPEDECETIETPESTNKTDAKSGKLEKALHPLGRKSPKAPKSKASVPDKGEGTSEETVEDQSKNGACLSQKFTKRMSDTESSDQEVTVLSSRPTRSGRVSKPVHSLNYPAKEDKSSSSSDTTLTSPARQTTAAAKAKGKTSGKRRRLAQQQAAKESKKPKLITLRASQSEEDSDDEEEVPEAQHYDENSTSAFVPASLCSPKPVIPEVEETMEELDFLNHMPDVLGMSQNALCPDASCEQEQNERGTVEPCEHQLDLLVDVIDFLSEHTETSGDEGYNEAAQTLLAIGKLTNLSQPTESEASMSDHMSKLESGQCSEVDDTSKSSLQLEECTQAASQPSTAEVSPTVELPTVELPTFHASDTQAVEFSEEACSTQEKSSPPRKGRFSKIKPKPNIGSRTTQLRTQTVGAAIETKQNELETATTCQPQSPEQQESTEAVFEPPQTESTPTDNTTAMPSHISNTNVSLELLKGTDMSPKPTPAPETTTSFSPIKEERPSTIKQIQGDLSTSEETVEVLLEKTHGDLAPTSQLSSLEHQEKSTLPVSEQSNTKNETTVNTKSEMTVSQTSDTQAIKHGDESCSSQETTTTSELATPSKPRKGRLSKIKPKPNIARASRTTKLPLKSGVAIEEKMQSECEIADTSEPQSAALSVSETAAACCRESQQESLTFNSQGTESDLMSQSSQSQEQTESGSQRTLETHLEPLQEKCGTPFVQCEEKPQAQLEPVIKSFATIESGDMDSIQSDHSSEEVKTANTRPVQQSHPSSENSKLGIPQRRRWIPKVKPKLVSSPRTTKSKVEANETSDTTERLVESNAVAATSEQQAPPDESSATNQTNVEHCTPIEAGKTVHRPQDTILKNTGVCQESTDSSNSHLEISDHSRPADGAVEPFSELQHNEAAAVSPSGSDKVQDSSVQNMLECQKLFPCMLPDQVPSDPDEPFFILSLSEIPVCPSGEVVMEAQQRYPVEPVVPPASGIDISLSNIHIPTPEKAALGSGLICVEEYLPSAPSVNISILAEPQEHPSVRRLTLPDAQNNSNNKVETPLTGNGTVDTKTKCRGQNMSSTAAAEDANTHTDTTQDHTKPSAEFESGEMVENIDSKSQKERDFSVTSKIKLKSAGTRGKKPQNRKTKATHELLWEETETQSSGSSTSKIMPCSFQSNQNPSICVSSEPLHSQQIDSTNLEEEPTNISECFFSDVFTEVQEIPGDSACHGKTQRKPAETMATTRQQRKTNTSSKLPHGQNNSQEEQPTKASVKEATSSSSLENTTASSAFVRTIDSSQLDKKAHVKGNLKNKALSEAKVDNLQQIKSGAVKLPSRDYLTESTSSSCTVPGPSQESCQQSSLRSTSAPVSHQNDSIECLPFEEEPTSVSQYFISDVFTEVESDDCTVIGKKSNDTTCTDQSKTAKTINSKKLNSNIKASNNSSCGQRSSLTEEQTPEVSITKETLPTSVKTPSTSAVTETTSESSQVDAKKTSGKGRANKKKQASCDGVKSQRKCKETFPEAVSLDVLKKPEDQRSLRGAPEFPVSKNDCTESNKEPTNVSHYQVVDALIEVESGTCSVTEKANKDDACTGETRIQTSETRGKTRGKRKTKASTGPPCSQHNPLTEEQPPEASVSNQTQRNVKSADLNQSDTEKTRGKESSNRNNTSAIGAKAGGSRSQRQCTAARKAPETPPTERIKENPRARSAKEQPQLPVHQSDPKDSSDDEPTNVSQFFLSDVFTEVDEEFKS